MIALRIDRLIKAAILLNNPGSTTTSTATTEAPSLTLESYLEMREKLNRPVWYATSPHVEKGKYCCLPESEFNPEYWVVHTDDEMAFCDAVHRDGKIARHVREWQPKIRVSSFLFNPGS